MLNNDNPKKSISNENNFANTQDVKSSSKLSKIETKVEKSDKINSVPNTRSSKISEKSDNDQISITNYNENGPIIDILEDNISLGDEKNETNKEGKVSIAPIIKKKLNTLSENKQTVAETSNKIINNTPSTLSTDTNKNSKYATETNKPGTVTPGHFKTVAAEKKNSRGEFSKKSEVMHTHQRTNSMFTPIIYDSKLDDKKSGISNIANMMV